MKHLHKMFALLLALAMTFALTACSKTDEPTPSTDPSQNVESPAPSTEPSTEPEPAGIYTPGTYSAEAQGFGGTVTVEVTVDANAITDVVITGDGETPGIGGAAVEKLPDEIKANGLDFDGMSGATYTSTAIRDALTEALSKAAG